MTVSDSFPKEISFQTQFAVLTAEKVARKDDLFIMLSFIK